MSCSYRLCRQFRNVPNYRFGNDKALVHFDGLGAGIAVLKVQTVLVVAGPRLVVACQRHHDLILVVRRLGVFQADLPGITDCVNAVIQVVVQGDDVLPGSVVLGARRDVQVLDDIVRLLDSVLRALGDVGEILAGRAVLFQIATIEGLRAGADLAVEILEQVVVFAQAAVEVLLGEGCLAASLVLLVITVIVLKAIGVAERFEVIGVNIVVQLGNLGGRLRDSVAERLDHKENDQGDDDCHQHNDNGDKQLGAALFGGGGLW